MQWGCPGSYLLRCPVADFAGIRIDTIVQIQANEAEINLHYQAKTRESESLNGLCSLGEGHQCLVLLPAIHCPVGRKRRFVPFELLALFVLTPLPPQPARHISQERGQIVVRGNASGGRRCGSPMTSAFRRRPFGIGLVIEEGSGMPPTRRSCRRPLSQCVLNRLNVEEISLLSLNAWKPARVCFSAASEQRPVEFEPSENRLPRSMKKPCPKFTVSLNSMCKSYVQLMYELNRQEDYRQPIQSWLCDNDASPLKCAPLESSLGHYSVSNRAFAKRSFDSSVLPMQYPLAYVQLLEFSASDFKIAMSSGNKSTKTSAVVTRCSPSLTRIVVVRFALNQSIQIKRIERLSLNQRLLDRFFSFQQYVMSFFTFFFAAADFVS